MAPGAMKWVLAPSLGERGAEDEGGEGGGAGRGGMVAKKGAEPVVVVIEVVVVVVVVIEVAVVVVAARRRDGFALVEFVFARDAARRRGALGVVERACQAHAVVHQPRSWSKAEAPSNMEIISVTLWTAQPLRSWLKAEA